MSKAFGAFSGAYSRHQNSGMPHMDHDSSFSHGKRKRLNVVSMLINVLAPWLVFCGVFGAMSFYTHYTSPLLAWLVVLAVV